MKRLLTAVLATIMVFGFSTTAFAGMEWTFPDKVSATATSTSVTLKWSVRPNGEIPLEDFSGCGITRVGPDGTKQIVPLHGVLDTSSRSYTDKTVMPGTTYRYKVYSDCILQDGSPWTQFSEVIVTTEKAVNQWYKYDGQWFYADGNSNLQKGWFKQGKKWYYLGKEDGAMATGVYKVGSRWSSFASSGKWNGYISNTGWKKYPKGWSFKANGKWSYGWTLINNNWYFFDSAGYMKTGWVRSGSSWYYMTSSGAMAKGWVKSGKATYYMNPASGAMMTGWVFDGNKRCFMKSSGAMAINEWSNDGNAKYWQGADGAAVTGYVEIDGKTYSFDETGKCLGIQKNRN